MSTTLQSTAGTSLQKPPRRTALGARIERRLQQLRQEPKAPIGTSVRAVPADRNHIQLSGRLDREPLLFDVGDHHCAALHLVCERSWVRHSGAVERGQDAFRLTAWEELADSCGRLLHTGDRVLVEGRLRLFSSWLGGIEHSAHEILLDRVVLLASAAGCHRDASSSFAHSGHRESEPSTSLTHVYSSGHR
jgi:single-stranded DNA-binding protein